MQLLSLKAELARKKNEAAAQTGIARFSGDINPNLSAPKPSTKSKERREKVESESSNAKSRDDAIEDAHMLQKSQRILLAKAKFYDKMIATGGSFNSDDTCLVMFSEKKAQETWPGPMADLPPDDSPTARRRSSSSSSSVSSDTNDDDDLLPNEQWVEYTDCLGRTRKCLRKDLEFFKKKDSELAREAAPKEEVDDDRRSETPERERHPKVVPGPSYAQPNPNAETLPFDRDSKLAEMRKNWEEKEVVNANRDEIHYQDVLFDEARTHGVGYYGFSHHEEERAKQLEQLNIERESTKEAQKQRELQIKSREKIIAERVLAAKNRQRERLGLPRLEKNDNEEQEKVRMAARAEEKRKRKERERQDELEAEGQRNAKIRRQHLRPWDKDKSGRYDDTGSEDEIEEWKYKPEREPMSQEQWVATQRETRNTEFAPPQSMMASAAVDTTTKPPMQRVRRNAEFFPPSTTTSADGTVTGSGIYDYFNQYKVPQSRDRGTELESSIEAGLRFLRDQADKNATTTKYTWTQNADY